MENPGYGRPILHGIYISVHSQLGGYTGVILYEREPYNFDEKFLEFSQGVLLRYQKAVSVWKTDC